jgi:hypothetical protein
VNVIAFKVENIIAWNLFWIICTDMEIPLHCEQIVLRIWVCLLIANLIFIVMSIFYSHALKLLRLIHTITFYFSTLDSLLRLYFALVRSKLEYASFAWNCVMITGSNKLEHIQRKIAAHCHSRLSKIWNITMIIYWKDEICWHCITCMVTLILCS